MGVKTDLEEQFDYDLIDEFLDHYTLMVESLEIIILNLTNEKLFKRSTQELFRIFHNIKSISGFLTKPRHFTLQRRRDANL